MKELLYGRSSKMLVFDKDYIEFCYEVAKCKKELQGDLLKVYSNLLFLKSEKTKVLFYLHQLDEKGILDTVQVDFISSDTFGSLFSNRVKIKDGTPNGNLVSRKILPKLILKYLANKVFFLLKAKIKKQKVIKAWVEITEKIYKDELSDSQILIYPFPLKLHRQLSYVYKKKKKSEKIGLMGVPYKIAPLLRAIFSKSYDKHVATFEQLGAIEQAEYYAKQRGLKQIFTTEEFEVGSYTFAKLLGENNIDVINSCHGLSVYAPFVSYAKFNLINKKQKELYSVFNEGLNFEMMYAQDYKPSPIPIERIVFVDQGDLTKFGLYYEAILREKTLGKLNELGKIKNVPIQIKMHPNTKQKEANRVINKFKNLPLPKQLNIDSKTTIFITLYSTAYYDFRKMGNFVFIKDDMFDPSFFFGPEIDTIDIGNLESHLEQLIKNAPPYEMD